MATALLVACSKEKDAFLNRTYHRLTARDNGWFNANEKLKEVVAGIEKDYPEDFDKILPIHVYGTEEQAKGAIPELEKCIEKCATVIDRHSMQIKDKERNRWIDDAYLVIAKSKFYERKYYDAQRTSDYIGRKFKGQDKQLEGKLLLARTLIELEQYAKAQTTLDEVRNEKELPKHFPHDELSALQADLDLRRGKVDDAITNLERAIEVAERKKDKVRWSFILAQLYQAKGHEEKATAQFARVTRMGAPYELDFHARIYEALAFDAGSSKAIRQKLNRMLRDDKHVDHFDMIHYALADLDLKESQDSSAIDHLRTSARVSTTDTRQKGKCFLKLADLYFEKRKYASAQQYYDSTQVLLTEEDPRFEEVKVRAEVLGDLVEQLRIIDREDSLRALSKLDPEEQKKRIERIIRDREQAEEARKEAEAAARETESTTLTPTKGPGTAAPVDGAWYFYNPTTVARGAAEFRKKWGARPLEDDWRRKDRSGSAVNEEVVEEEETGGDEGDESEDAAEWKDPKYYLKDIPSDSTAIAASDGRICEALYRSGMIYKEKLRDTDNAVESFENLNSRFDECRYTPESYYQLYRIYLEKERDEKYINFSGMGSQTYANIIMERWPDSEFARLVRDPNALQADAARMAVASAEYEQLYRNFRQGDYLGTITACNTVIANEPRNPVLAKYHLLKAMAVGGMKELSAFRAALEDVKTKFGGSDEARAASDILAVLDGQGAKQPPANDKSSSAPSFRVDQGQHYFALLFPTADGNIMDVKARISDFNRQFFPGTTIQVTSSFLNADMQVILLSVFETKGKAMEYYDLFLSQRPELAGINDQGYTTFAITPDNYSALYKSKNVDAYSAFFVENYLEGQ